MKRIAKVESRTLKVEIERRPGAHDRCHGAQRVNPARVRSRRPVQPRGASSESSSFQSPSNPHGSARINALTRLIRFAPWHRAAAIANRKSEIERRPGAHDRCHGAQRVNPARVRSRRPVQARGASTDSTILRSHKIPHGSARINALTRLIRCDRGTLIRANRTAPRGA